MLAPKKLKRRKPHKPKVGEKATRNTSIAFGKFAMKATTGGWLSAQQIESARRVITRYTRRGGKMWIRVFPHRAITSKGSQVTMGGGKGIPEKYIAVIRPGNIIFELDGIEEKDAKEAMELAGYKFPMKTKFIVKK